MPEVQKWSLILKNMPLVLLILLVTAWSAQAQTVAQSIAYPQDVTIPEPPALGTVQGKRSLELSGGSRSLNAGFSNWREVTLRGVYGLPRHLLQGELSVNRRFDQDGAFIGVSDTYTFNEDWFASAAVGAGDGAFYLPRYRIDTTLYRKLLPKRNLVGSIGLGYYSAPDGHVDRSLSLGAAYYFDAPWIVEGGVRLNRSNPGAVRTQQQFVAVTYGRDKENLVTARYGWGGEGYLAISANVQMVNFDSREASVAWRHWLNRSTGVLLSANRYTNPLYQRSGFNVGIFHDF